MNKPSPCLDGKTIHAPLARMPVGAWDTHFHAPHSPGQDHNTVIETVRAMHRSIGIQRGVMVQSLLNGATDEDYLQALDSAPEWRGVALIREGTTDAHLDRLHLAGVRAIRLTYVGFLDRRPTTESFRRDIRRASERDWHLLLHIEPENLIEMADTIAALPLPVVIDHCAHINTAKGLDQLAGRSQT